MFATVSTVTTATATTIAAATNTTTSAPQLCLVGGTSCVPIDLCVVFPVKSKQRLPLPSSIHHHIFQGVSVSQVQHH